MRRLVAVAALAAVAAAGCGSSGRTEVAPRVTPTPSATPSSSPTPAPTELPSLRPRPMVPAYHSSIHHVTAAELGKSWRSGCPVAPRDLRAVRVSYYGFDRAVHTGTLVVHASVAATVGAVFGRLYDARFPIHRMEPIAAYSGDDDASMAADNTSAFNCRAAVSSGTQHWSMHAYGKAVDVNPVENPYLFNGGVLPPNGASYTDRGRSAPGMAKPGGTLVRAFAVYGWGWGGSWSSSKDYQHFSTNGQ